MIEGFEVRGAIRPRYQEALDPAAIAAASDAVAALGRIAARAEDDGP